MITTSQSAVRFGVLGAARVLLTGLVQPARAVPAADIRALASRTPGKARRVAAQHGIPAIFDSYEALLAQPDIDAIYIALPPALHPEWAQRALQAGKHVLCEKPLAPNAAAAAEMANCAERHGLVLAEGMHVRYLTALRRQRSMIAGGELGRLRHVDATFRMPSVSFAKDDFRVTFELGGGAGLDLGCYAASCLRYVTDAEPTVLSAEARCEVHDVDLWMRALVALPSGASAAVECGLKGTYTPRFGVTAICQNGMIESGMNGLVWTKDGCRHQTPMAPDWTYKLQLEAFVRRVRGEAEDLVSLDDSVATARLIDAMYMGAGLPLRPSPSTVAV
jgi:predicted dehydrogenase